MSATSTTLSRPRRSSPRQKGARRSRGAVAPFVVLALSSCTAVAAERLPVDRLAAVDERPAPPDLRPGEPAVADGPGGSAPAGGAPGAEAIAGPAVAAGRPGATSAVADSRTIVAHATARSVVAYDEPDDGALEVARFTNPTDRGGPLEISRLDDVQVKIESYPAGHLEQEVGKDRAGGPTTDDRDPHAEAPSRASSRGDSR